MADKKVTFADIAAYTGFSKTTISRYFNNHDSLTVENQDKIADALKVLGYKENKLAKVLANGKTEMIGIIIPNLYFHYFAEILNQIISTYEKYGYKFIVFAGHNNKEVEYKYINELLAYNIEGLMILSHTIPSKELSELNIPTVTIEREDKYVCSVNSDNYMGGVQAVSLLIKCGCDVIVHINDNNSEEIPAHKRITGFKDCCAENGVPSELVLTDFGETFEENNEIILKYFNQVEEKYPDKKIGFFMPNDTYANILLNIIVRKYGALPERFCIVGYDGSPVSREAVIPISTISQHIDVIVEEAMELLVMQMNERKKRRPVPLTEPIHKVITPSLIKRNTTK